MVHITMENIPIENGRYEKRCYRSTSYMIFAIGLKFGGMMHSTTKQIAV